MGCCCHVGYSIIHQANHGQQTILQRIQHVRVLHAEENLAWHVVLSDDVPLVVSRQILQVFAQEIPKVPADVHKPIATQ